MFFSREEGIQAEEEHMFCGQCGKELGEGQRFCVFCGWTQEPAGAGGVTPGSPQPPWTPPPGPPVPPKSSGMKTGTIVIIAVVLALLTAGAVVGIYFGVRDTSPPSLKTTGVEDTGTLGPSVKGEKLAYINGRDIYTVNLDGAGRQKVTNRGDIVDFAVAPDGSRIAFVAASDTRRVIFMVTPDGKDLSQATLPGKGTAENPAFDATGKYIYFTRVTPEEQANIEAARPYAIGFERFDIAKNNVDRVYTYSGLQEQSINGLYSDPAGGDLYFNLYGSDWPSSVPHKLSPGTPASDEVYMPMQRDTGKYVAVAFQLTGFSRNGNYVSYFKAVLFANQDEASGPTQEVDAAFRPTGGGEETVAATYVPSSNQQGDVSGIEFSNVSNTTYYFARVGSAGPNASSLTLDFYKGTRSSSATLTGLSVSVSVDTEQYTPLVWHLLPLKE